MSGSSLSSPPRATEVSSSRRPQMAACDKNVGSSSRQAARPAREDQRTIRTRAEPSRTGAPGRKVPRPAKLSPRGSQRSGHLPFTNSTMVWTVPTATPCRGTGHGRSRRTVSTPSAPQAVDPGAAPRRLQSLLIQGGRALDVHVSLITGGGQGPTPTIAEVGGSAPVRSGERVVAVEAAVWSGAAPELAGSKRAAAEQGSSGRPMKKSRVGSKM
jgi:hypothetical protein